MRGPILRWRAPTGCRSTTSGSSTPRKQSKRISANVSGFFGTERMSLNDNLLNRTSLPEIEAVMGHEIGHYVLNHVYKMLVDFGLVILVGFLFLRWSFDGARRRWGGRWGIRGVADLAGLPLVVALFSIYLFALTPVHQHDRSARNEDEADIFGLNASRQPDGFAAVALKLGEYRKLDPGPWEERIFFDHPERPHRIYGDALEDRPPAGAGGADHGADAADGGSGRGRRPCPGSIGARRHDRRRNLR